MPGFHPRRLLAALLVLLPLSGFAPAGEIHSTMRNVNAVMEAHGFRLTPVYDVEPPQNPGDLAPTQVFEIERPLDKAVTIGRLFTSCSCIQLETNKRTFRPGERAILFLRNIRPTPANGQLYAIFVQITSPIRTTLRFDTFVQTGSGAPPLIDSGAAQDGTDGTEADLDDPLVSTSTDEDDETGTAAFLAATVPAEEGDGEQQVEALPESGREGPEAEEPFLDEAPAPGPAGADSLGGDLPDFDAQAASMPLAASPLADLPEPEVPEHNDTPVPSVQDQEPAPAPAATDDAPPARDPEARKPVQMVSLITIGVRDMQAAMNFYEGLGWRRAARGKYDQTAFFQLQGQILALYPMNDLLREQNMAGATPAPGGITLALHVSDKADVWAVYQRFVEAGGTSLRAPTEVASGAVSCYVADPDGNAWEISWVPQFRIDDEGGLWLP